MAKPNDADFVAALSADLRGAWDWIQARKPTERLYAFGLYTTEEALSFCPFACGDAGLSQVAEEYVRNGHYADVNEAMTALKWSIADSPYLGKLPSERTETELRKRPDLTGDKLSAAAYTREIRARLNLAVAALKALDEEGLFGTREERRGVTLLIEAGDREEEFVLKWAKKLNPPAVFRAYEALYTPRVPG